MASHSARAHTKASAERFRGRKLQEARKRLFAKHPLCVECERQGRVRLATQRDHIVALVNGGQDIESNTQGLCGPCHEAKTARDLGNKHRQTIGLDGWPK
jgi:5-methylcytosine-specific restriction protein A